MTKFEKECLDKLLIMYQKELLNASKHPFEDRILTAEEIKNIKNAIFVISENLNK